MTDDDDLRFGDVGGSDSGGGIGRRIPSPDVLIEWFTTGFLGLIFLYILVSVADTLYDIPLI